MASRIPFRQALKDQVLVVDGAMGTQIYAHGVHLSRCFDEINLSNPYLISKIHHDYIDAGARVIETNTFGASRVKLDRYTLGDRIGEVIAAGCKLALDAARDTGVWVYVAGSIGPLGLRLDHKEGISAAEAGEAFEEQAGLLLENGVDLLILETFGDPAELELALASARKASSDLPVVVSAVFDEKVLVQGRTPEELLKMLLPHKPDAAGLNCRLSIDRMLPVLERMHRAAGIPLIAMADAGQSRVVEDRDIYISTPEFVAEHARRAIQGAGVKMIGGCCGTNPAHIRAIAATVRMLQPGAGKIVVTERAVGGDGGPKVELTPWQEKTPFAAKLAAGKFVSSVEIRPPRGLDDSGITGALAGLAAAGVDAMNIPDGPRATARMHPVHIASRLNTEPDRIEVIVHYTCRDRNLLGMQADLLGAWKLGQRNILAVTGDPPKLGDYPDATAVFDVDSIGLIGILNRLNHGEDLAGRPLGEPTCFLIGAGCNPAAIDPGREVERLWAKIEAGAEYVFTQPVFEQELLDSFLHKAGKLPVPVLAGYYPLYSFNNAEFLHNEVPGMTIPDHVRARMKAAKSKEAARRTGVEIAREALESIHTRVQGAYIMPPFDKWELAVAVLEGFIDKPAAAAVKQEAANE
ncbi:MAG: bifunctional homocysteine S-methyltransferase/methylenetetrahydrofolate reductase [Candidatus Glassbacteria bacterium]|nr:bifunctional homocysteine S-methyltransferase/methylenetetrahydrofolate reductase [Candidatus Glassbacteria bacterium]